MSGRIRRWLREPLLHFTLAAAVVFGIYHRVAPPQDDASHIVVSPALVERLRADHERRVGKPPTAQEQQALVDRFIDNEILYREALALGLDKDDVIVRRRLIQKMEFILERGAESEPSDRDLEDFLQAHRERYLVPERLSFTHVFIRSSRSSEESAALAQSLADRLQAGADATSLGDPFLHGNHLSGRSATEVVQMFGAAFADRVFGLPLAKWSEPIRSAYGLHLVRVDAWGAASLPALADVRTRLREDWQVEQRAANRQRALQRLRESYGIK